MFQSGVILEKNMEVPQPLIEGIYAGLCARFDSCKKQSVSKISVSEPGAGGEDELGGFALWGVACRSFLGKRRKWPCKIGVCLIKTISDD